MKTVQVIKKQQKYERFLLNSFFTRNTVITVRKNVAENKNMNRGDSWIQASVKTDLSVFANTYHCIHI